MRIDSRLEVDGQIGGFLEVAIHLEHMVGRREHHVARALGVGENHRLEYIHHLCDVGHLHPFGVLVEDVEREGGHHCVAHTVLLVEVSTYGARFLVPPSAPFVHHEGHAVLGVGLVHHGDVVFHQFVHLEAGEERVVVFAVGEAGGRPVFAPVAHGIVV